MNKLKLYYLVGKEWVMEKWYGSVIDRFLVACIASILLFLLLIVVSSI